jgi:hypothetical protein
MAAEVPMRIDQRADFERSFLVRDRFRNPIDLTGCDAKMDIRDTPGGTLRHSLTVDNGGISVSGPEGKVTLRIPASVTATFTWTESAYDLFLVYSDGTRKKRLKGPVIVDLSYTE